MVQMVDLTVKIKVTFLMKMSYYLFLMNEHIYLTLSLSVDGVVTSK